MLRCLAPLIDRLMRWTASPLLDAIFGPAEEFDYESKTRNPYVTPPNE